MLVHAKVTRHHRFHIKRYFLFPPIDMQQADYSTPSVRADSSWRHASSVFTSYEKGDNASQYEVEQTTQWHGHVSRDPPTGARAIYLGINQNLRWTQKTCTSKYSPMCTRHVWFWLLYTRNKIGLQCKDRSVLIFFIFIHHPPPCYLIPAPGLS